MPFSRGPLVVKFPLSLQSLGSGAGQVAKRWGPTFNELAGKARAARAKLVPSSPRGSLRLALLTTLGLTVSLALLAQSPSANTSANASLSTGASSGDSTQSGTANTGASSSSSNTPTNSGVASGASAANSSLNDASAEVGVKTMPTPLAKSMPLRAAPTPPSSSAPSPSRPLWGELTAPQQLALQPLNLLWSGITQGQKRKWLALVDNFSSLNPKDQDKLQQRMQQWASMSTQERAQARVIFSQVQQLSGDDRLSKWQAYEALEPTEKTKLANSTKMLPNSAAISPAPLALHPTASVNLLFPESFSSTRLETEQLSRKTLLPPKTQPPSP